MTHILLVRRTNGTTSETFLIAIVSLARLFRGGGLAFMDLLLRQMSRCR